MCVNDQIVRSNSYSKLSIHEVDESNAKYLNEIFAKYNFPQKPIIRSNAAYDTPDEGSIYFHILLMYQDELMKKKYLPLFLEAVKKGKLEPDKYAEIYDRDLITREGIQLYGALDCPNEEKCPLKNESDIDVIRKSIGLPHIKYYPWKIKQIKNKE